jgi:hypothetical protein
MTSEPTPEARVDAAIVKRLVPELYGVIDELLEHAGTPLPKDVVVRARRLLPRQYRHAFEKPRTPK